MTAGGWIGVMLFTAVTAAFVREFIGRRRVSADAEVRRLRKLFEDAGGSEHNVLALIDYYQDAMVDAQERIRDVRRLLEEHGCDCECDHHHDECRSDCKRCLACRIGEVVGA